MSIQALPQSTVRALGATQALTDPASLVKELLDNALDARANSVAISISSNTLDVIQVRDNGHGITPQDRPLVARRYCTSKICDDQDLKDIRGTSLGFRGEALASAAELSGSLLISTRIEGEQVATSLNISQQGEVVGQSWASLPVGTTVKITDFIKANPVRRQVALKNVDSCLKKIKRLLQAYAFARPHVRYSLQVLKAKNKKADWVYAPKSDRNAEDAAFKIVGADCASTCLWSVFEDQGLTVQAFLPRADADVSKISNIGSFVSIDARPVSSARGLLKQISKAFRESLKSANNKFDGVKEPFIFLEISGGSYDANLEPSKDDVLFENADMVLGVVKQFFAVVYVPMVPPVAAAEHPTSAAIANAVPQEDSVELFTSLEEEVPTASIQNGRPSRDARKDVTEDWLESLNMQQTTRKPSTPARVLELQATSNMYGFDDEDLVIYNDRPTTGLTEADFAELRQSRKNVTLSNPWVFAKMNTSIKAPVFDDDKGHRSTSPARPRPLAANLTRESSPTIHQQDAAISGLPTPRPSSLSPPPNTFHPSHNVPGFQTIRGKRPIASPELTTTQDYTPVPSIGLQIVDNSTANRLQHPAASEDPHTLDRNAAEPAGGTRLSDIPNATTRPRRAAAARINKQFVPPSKDHAQRDQVWFDPPRESRKPRAQRTHQGNTDSLVALGEVGEVLEDTQPLTPPRRNRDIRDFVERDASSLVSSMIERRNINQTTWHREPSPVEGSIISSAENVRLPEAPRRHRGFVPASELFGMEKSTPHFEQQQPRGTKRRKTTDRTPLQGLTTNNLIEPSEARDEADRRRETSSRAPSRRRSSKRLNRTKSSRLPLEKVPTGQATHDMIFSVATSIEWLRRLAGKIDWNNSLLSYDESAESCKSNFDVMEDSEVQSLTTTLHQLLIAAGSDTDVVDSADLFAEMQAAMHGQRAIDTESEMLMMSSA